MAVQLISGSLSPLASLCLNSKLSSFTARAELPRVHLFLNPGADNTAPASWVNVRAIVVWEKRNSPSWYPTETSGHPSCTQPLVLLNLARGIRMPHHHGYRRAPLLHRYEATGFQSSPPLLLQQFLPSCLPDLHHKASPFKTDLPQSALERFALNFSQTENYTHPRFKSLCWEKLNIISG